MKIIQVDAGALDESLLDDFYFVRPHFKIYVACGSSPNVPGGQRHSPLQGKIFRLTVLENSQNKSVQRE
jgi:hypothetical protein